MLITSNSSTSENSCKLFNLKDLLIQPMDYEEGFQTENKNVGKHWKHWVLEISVDFVNTKYRKHHRSSSDKIVVIHQTSISQQTQLSELNERDQ